MKNEIKSSVNYYKSLATNGTVFVKAAKNEYPAGYARILYAAPNEGDLVWQEASITYDDRPGNGRISLIGYDNNVGVFYAVSEFGDSCFYISPNGIDWDEYNMGLSGEHQFLGVSIADNGNIIVTSNGDTVFYSNLNTPSTWSVADVPYQGGIWGVTNDGMYFYAWGYIISRASVNAPSEWESTLQEQETPARYVDMASSGEYIVKYDLNRKIERFTDFYQSVLSPVQPTFPSGLGGGNVNDGASIAIINDILYMYGYITNTTGSLPRPFVALSRDMGTTWSISEIPDFIGTAEIIDLAFSSDGQGMISTANGDFMWMSDDFGESFYRVTPIRYASDHTSSFKRMATNGVVYITTAGYRSHDNTPIIYCGYPDGEGLIWSEASITYNDKPEIFNCGVYALSYSPHFDIFYGVGDFYFYTSKDGLNWDSYYISDTVEFDHCILEDNGIIIATAYHVPGKVFHSNIEDIIEWHQANTNLDPGFDGSSNFAYGLASDGQYFYVHSDVQVARANVATPDVWESSTLEPGGWHMVDTYKILSEDYIVQGHPSTPRRYSDLFTYTESTEQPSAVPMPDGGVSLIITGLSIHNDILYSYGHYKTNSTLYGYLAFSKDIGNTWEISYLPDSQNVRFTMATFNLSGQGMIADRELLNIWMSEDYGVTFKKVNAPLMPGK